MIGIILFLKFCFVLVDAMFIALIDFSGFGVPILTPRCLAR